MQAGRLRHRIDIQELRPVRDPVTLEFGEPEWVTRWEKCPASVEDLSARDFIAAQAGQAQAGLRRQPFQRGRHGVQCGLVESTVVVDADPLEGRAGPLA